ncbi:MAG: thiamine diphosphokinase [Ruminiclostridium sp.]|nr:thiamine diphosphokinase [Ruminiclostridium sp.]
MKRCFIIAAGDKDCYIPPVFEDDYVIAADRGFELCKEMGIKPDLAVGDWDSLNCPPEDCPMINLPVEKDDTDTLAAIKIGLDKGYEEFHILFGAGGKRVDHTIANVQCLLYLAKRKKKGYLYFKESVITAVTNGFLSFLNNVHGNLAIFAADGTAHGVYEKGLKYSLDNADVSCDFPIGVSNSFTGLRSEISVKDGSLYIVFPKEVFPCERS